MVRSQAEMAERELKICEFNLENLFVSMEYYAGEKLEQMSEEAWRYFALPQLRSRQKPLSRVLGVAKAILDIDADILMLVEVGGRESLENLNRHFLGSRYDVHFVEGNARRAIDLGYLVRKNLGYRIETLSNRDTPVAVTAWHGTYQSKFSRDVAELRLHDDRGLQLMLLLTHLKSKLSTEADVKGKDVRSAEAAALAAIYEKLHAENPDVPIIVGGDFNADLGSLELELLRRTDLTDFHDLIGTPEEDRVSLVHFNHVGAPQPLVLDYLLISPQLRDRVVGEKSFTYRYKGFYGIPEAVPGSLRERYQMPSDHYPLVLTLRVR